MGTVDVCCAGAVQEDAETPGHRDAEKGPQSPRRKRRRAPKGRWRPPEAKSGDLPPEACRKLHNHLNRLTCSDPWHWDLYKTVKGGQIPFSHDFNAQAQALSHAEAYPPGGDRTLMRRCRHCARWTPAGAIGSARICYDCFIAAMPIGQMVRLPSSPGFDQSFSAAQVAGWLGINCFERRKRVRRLLPADDRIASQATYRVLETAEGDDGFVQETVFAVAGTPDEAAA